MTLIEGFVRDEIFIDFGVDILYGSDQCYINYPCRFPTVGFQLMATNGLSQIADRIRKDMGVKPMHPMDEFTDDTCDNDGWYDFYVGINGYAQNHMDSCIEFVVVNSESDDNEQRYTIDLTTEEQEVIYARLDEQCRRYLGKGCEELLAEARKQMEEDES
ncbi:MAG TPA: hypothetical protein DCG70_04810 [Lachnoclostridium sp.]|nr:hypothetical protein [Lachnoclostridium sp.]